MAKIRLVKSTILSLMLVISLFASMEFVRQKSSKIEIFPSEDLSYVKMLSNYMPALENTLMDTPVFFFEGEEEGGTVFIMGGTHPNESAGILSAVLVLENIRIDKGRVIVLPVANMSALSQTLPGYAYPEQYSIGSRSFKIGSRVTSPLDQWPDPPIFVQKPYNQFLSYEEARNLNRNYPGSENGSVTQMLAKAITNLLRTESVDYAFDLHEASITYPVNRAVIVPEKTLDTSMLAILLLSEKGIEMGVETASANLRGFSYIDWAEIDGVHPFLIEVPTPVTDRIQGMMIPSLVTLGKDCFIKRVSDKGYTGISFGDEGMPLSYRCALHLATISEILNVAAMFDDDPMVTFQIPTYDEIIENGLENLLEKAKDSDSMQI